MYQRNEILLYTDLFDKQHEVIYLETSSESGNHCVILQSPETEREIWLRDPQVKGTGRIYERPKAGPIIKQSWTIGDEIPQHLIKKKSRKKA